MIMKNKKYIVVLIIFILIIVILFVGYLFPSKDVYTGGPFYFKRFSADYSKIKKPIDEITEAEAIKRRAYFIAYFDSQGRVVSIEKKLADKMLFKEIYEYDQFGELKNVKYILPDKDTKENPGTIERLIHTEP